jgi:hypothetical protein
MVSRQTVILLCKKYNNASSGIITHTANRCPFALSLGSSKPCSTPSGSSRITCIISWVVSRRMVSHLSITDNERSNFPAGSGAVYSFDPVGSYEREACRAAGAAQSLVQPFLDNQVGGSSSLILSNRLFIPVPRSTSKTSSQRLAARTPSTSPLTTSSPSS